MPAIFLNGTTSQKADFNTAITYLSKTPEGLFLASQLASRDVYISFNTNGLSQYTPNPNLLEWDTRASLNIINKDGQIEAISAANVLAHELHHWYQRFSTSSLDEEWAVEFAGRIASQLGEPVRPRYDAIYGVNKFIRTDSTTSHTQWGYWRKVEGNTKEFGPLYDPTVKVITETGDGVTSGGGDGIPENGHGTGGGGSPVVDDSGPKVGGGYWVPVNPIMAEPVEPDQSNVHLENDQQAALVGASDLALPSAIIS